MHVKESEKFVASNILEGMTSVSALLNAQGQGYNDRRVQQILIDRSRVEKLSREIRFLQAKAKELCFEIRYTSNEEIAQHTIGNSHGGVIAFCTERTIPELRAEDIHSHGFYVYLEGIEDPYNFGYTIRSLYAAGVDGVILSPRNWMSAGGVVARSSAGASELLPLFLSEPDTMTTLFHEAGYRIYAAGIRDSVSIYDAELNRPLLLIVGGEKRGISRALLDRADQIVRIDYGRDFRGSLSAASAATVMAFEVMRQNMKNHN
jgi:23S rRNA (guanosine2251-2'-O)-methyltransferase